MPAARDFTMTRIFDSPRALVYEAWTDPRQLARWWGPKNFTNPICQTDVRPGGAHRIVMRGPDGVDYPIKGFYREVKENERLVLTNDLSENPESWHDIVNPERDRSKGRPSFASIETVKFEDAGSGKTRLTIQMHFEQAQDRDALLKTGMNEGWSQSLDRLGELLSAKGAAS